MLVNGINVEYRTNDGAIWGEQAQVVDFDNSDNNDWLAVNQFTVTENRNTRRPDIVPFLNGLPLGVIELKNPATRTPLSGPLGSNSRLTGPNCPPYSP